MKRTLLLFALCALGTLGFAAADPMRPHLETRHGVRQLIVNGQPFLILGGELHNSSSSSRDYMKPVWPRLVAKKLNTVLAAVTWELLEPAEGRFDFSVVDELIQDARQNQLHLVFLWFGSWKNGESSYPPAWVKTNSQRFPLAQKASGENLNVLSTFGAATRDADARAFAALMHHIREVDGRDHTVLMIQVENEVGVLGDSRDHSPAANEAFAQAVPKELMDYLQQHKDTLAPELREAWTANGAKTAGTWTEVFGRSRPAEFILHYDLTEEEQRTELKKFHWPGDEVFMAWQYARYVNQVTAAGKAEYDIPMYANGWLQQATLPWPGTYPSGGPVPQVADVWRCGAPAVDLLAPDIYVPDFAETCEKWTRNGNPLFVPEADGRGPATANVLTAIIKHNAIGFSPFGIDGRAGPQPEETPQPGAPRPVDALAESYAVLTYLAPVILENQGRGTMAVLPPAGGPDDPPQQVKLGDYNVEVTYATPPHFGPPPAPGQPAPPSPFGPPPNPFPGRLIINTGPDEFLIVGGNMNLKITATAPGPKTVRLLSCKEIMLQDGKWIPGRQLNGDETEHNRRWPFFRPLGIYRVKVYRRD